MRTLRFIALSLPLSMSAALTGCAASDAPTTDDQGVSDPASDPGSDPAAISPSVSAPTKITIKTDEPLALVAYRDFDDATWHLADQKAPNRFVAKVHGPYWVTAVCVTDNVYQGQIYGHNVDVEQLARTLGDGAELSPGCIKPGPVTRDISGHMAQAGRILVGDNFAQSTTGDWTFQIPVRKGSYTLYASTPDRIVIRRGLDATRSVVIAPIDADVEGNPLAPVAFSVPNDDGVPTRAVVRVEQASGTSPGGGMFWPSGAAFAVPDDVLTRDDNQTVSVQAPLAQDFGDFQRSSNRASRRPWRIGDDASFPLPAQIGDMFWYPDANGDQVAYWSSVPAFTVFSIDQSGGATDPSFGVYHNVDLSPSFMAQTYTYTATFDTQIPGFSPDWRIDRSAGYYRDATAQLLGDLTAPEHGTIDTSTINDFVAATTPAPGPRARVSITRSLPTRAAHPVTGQASM